MLRKGEKRKGVRGERKNVQSDFVRVQNVHRERQSEQSEPCS